MIVRWAAVSLLFLCAEASAQRTSVGPAPPWVTDLDGRAEGTTDTTGLSGGVEYLLVDRQFHFGRQEEYGHQVLRYVSPTGVQGYSSVSVEFDPSYQTLTLHAIRIIRSGRVMEQLGTVQVQVLRRETELAASLYDGTCTAVVELHDVQVGDLLEWQFTLKGWNPAHAGRFHNRMDLGYAVPVGRLHVRVVQGSAPLQVRTYAGAGRPVDVVSDHGKELIWDMHDVHAHVFENDVPPWIDQAPGVELTGFADLNEVHSWAVGLFRLPLEKDDAIGALSQRFARLGERDMILDSALRWVQQEIRYLGVESGMAAYRPNPPAKVLSQRFGDCKDKSLLLCAILRGAGIEAWPALVSTSRGRVLPAQLVGHASFDHCIVAVEDAAGMLFVDPTIAYNGGPLRQRYVGDLGWALVLDPGKPAWSRVSDRSDSRIAVQETFTLDGLAGGARLEVETRYEGARADAIRAQFAGGGLKDIADGYRDFYARTYGELEVLGPISLTDQDSEGVFTTHESYHITEVWGPADPEDSTAGVRCEFYPQFLRDWIVGPSSPHRVHPYWCNGPIEVVQTIRVHLPEPWAITPDLQEIKAPGLRFLASVAYADSVIAASEVGSFREKQELMIGQLGYTLTYAGQAAGPSHGNWWLVFFVLVSLAIGFYVAVRIWRYDPPVAPAFENGESIGGWLILPAIGLVITPLKMLYEHVIYFRDITTWPLVHAPWSATSAIEMAQVLVIHAEIVLNAMLICCSIALVIMFFKRRTGIPRLLVGWYILLLVTQVVDGLAVLAVFDAPPGPDMFQDVTRSFVGACIWVPYFLVSTRVKNTFVIRLNGSRPTHEPSKPDPSRTGLHEVSNPSAESPDNGTLL
jgi:Protein of unknown function (DUF2569)/Domain of Unknown Function with PDB structure (DUF3857)/Transglutaminase-like superfamily